MDRYAGNSGGQDFDGGGILALLYVLFFAAFIFIIIFLFRTLPELFSILNKNIQVKWVLGLIGATATATVGVSRCITCAFVHAQYADEPKKMAKWDKITQKYEFSDEEEMKNSDGISSARDEDLRIRVC